MRIKHTPFTLRATLASQRSVEPYGNSKNFTALNCGGKAARFLASVTLSLLAMSVPSLGQAAEACDVPAVATCSPGSFLEEFVGKAGTPIAGLHFTTACTTEFPLLLANNFERTGQKVPIIAVTGTDSALKSLDRFKLLLSATGATSHFYTVLDQEKTLLGGSLFIQATPQRACREGATGVRLALPAPLTADGLVTDAVSQCAAKTTPVWRLLKQPTVAFNALNALTYPQHRLLTDYAQAVAQQADVSGFWKIEGVRACAPDEYARGTSAVSAVDASSGAALTTIKANTTFVADVLITPPTDNWAGIGVVPTKTIVNVFLPIGIGFSGTQGDYLNVCSPAVTVLGGQTVTCAIPRPTTAALLKLVLSVGAAYQPVSADGSDRTVKISLAGSGADGATLGLPMSAQGCVTNSVPHTSCSTVVLPAPTAVAQIKLLGVIAPAQINKFAAVDSSETIACENAATSTQPATNVRCAAVGLPSGVTLNCAPSVPTTLAPGAQANCDLRISATVPALSQPISFAASADGFPTKTVNSQLVIGAPSGGGTNGPINFSRPTNVALSGVATLSGGEISGTLGFDVTFPGVATNAVFYPQYQTANGWIDATPGGAVYAVQIDGSSPRQLASFVVPQNALGGATTITMRICAVSNVGANPPTCGAPNIVSEAPYALVSFSQAATPLTLRIVNPPASIPTSGQFTYSVVNASTTATGSNLVCTASNAVSGFSISCGASPNTLAPNGSSQCTCQVSGSATIGAAASSVALSAFAQNAAGSTISANAPAFVAMAGATVVPPTTTINLNNVSISAPTVTPAGAQLTLATTVVPSGTSGTASVTFYVQDRSPAAASQDWSSVGGQIVTLSSGTSANVSSIFTPSGSPLPTSIAVRVCVVDVANAFQQGACASGGLANVAKVSAETGYSLLPPANVELAWTNPSAAIRVGSSAVWVLRVSPPTAGTSPSGALIATVALPTNVTVNAAATDARCAQTGAVLHCALQGATAPVFATAQTLSLSLTPQPGTGGVAIRPAALVSNVQAGAVGCANGASGSNCAIANAMVPAYFDFAVPPANSITTAPSTGSPAVVNCSVVNGTGIPVPVTGANPACRAVVTFTDNSTQTIDVPFSAAALGVVGASVGQSTAGSQTTISVCANGTTASANQCANYSLASIKQIDVEIANLTALDNDSTNNKTIGVYVGSTVPINPPTSCVSGEVNVARGPYNGDSRGAIPGIIVNNFTGHVASFEFTRGPRYTPYLFGTTADLGDVNGKEIFLSNCQGDFNPATAQSLPFADFPQNTHGDVNYRIYTDAAAFANAPLGRNLLLPASSDRFYVNIRTKWCGAPGVVGASCRTGLGFAANY